MTKREEDYDELGDEDLANLLEESDGASYQQQQQAKLAFDMGESNEETDYAGLVIDEEEEELVVTGGAPEIGELSKKRAAEEEGGNKLQDAFDTFDVDGSGYISQGEFKTMLQQFGQSVSDLS